MLDGLLYCVLGGAAHLTDLLGGAQLRIARQLARHVDGRGGERVRRSTRQVGYVIHLVHDEIGQLLDLLGQVQFRAEAVLKRQQESRAPLEKIAKF